MNDEEYEQKKRDIINAFNAVIRTSALKEHDVGLQRLVLLMDQLLDQNRANNVLPVGPLYEYLKERKIDDDAILEALLVFKEREATYGFGLRAPPILENIPKDRRQRLLLRYQKRQRAAVRTNVDGAPKVERPRAVAPVERGGPGATRKLLIAILALVVVAGIGLRIYQENTAEPAASPVVIDDPKALPCEELRGANETLLCWMTMQRFTALPKAERAERGRATKAAGAGLGYKKLQVWTREDQKLRETY